MSRWLWISSVLLLASFQPNAAEANGRFPTSMSVEFRDGDNKSIVASVTFGLVLTGDDGQTWRWVCEEAIGFNGNFDPDYEIAADGTMFATTNGRIVTLGILDAGPLAAEYKPGLRVSRDNGCTWNQVAGITEGQVVSVVEIGPDGRVWAATASADGADDVYVAADTSSAFVSTGLTDGKTFWRTMVVAKTASSRVYASGLRPPEQLPDGGSVEREGLLYRTKKDGSGTWEKLSTASFTFGPGKDIFVLGVSPTDADTVYVRIVEATGPLSDSVWRSKDGGDSWKKVLDTGDFIAGFGVLNDGTLVVGSVNDGVHISTDEGAIWTRPTQQPRMLCIGERGDGDLFSCGANWDPDYFSLARSTDGAQTWTKVFRFTEIAGPLSCAPGTIQFDTCETVQWPKLKEMFGIGRPDAGPDTLDAGVDAGVIKPPKDDCNGCSVGMLAVFFVVPWRRRRRVMLPAA